MQNSKFKIQNSGLLLILIFTLCFVGFAGATVGYVTKSITAQNTFSEAAAMQGYFNLSLSGTWDATVTVQRSYDSGSTWVDVKTFTANTEEVGYEPETGVLYRFGVKTGAFTSGTVVGRISR